MSVVNSSVALPAEVSKDRFARGSATFAAVTGIPTEAFLDEFKDSSPDFGRYAIEWGFGDVYSRTDLDLTTRELVIIARSEEHTSELQSLMRISYAVFCLNKTTRPTQYWNSIRKKHT